MKTLLTRGLLSFSISLLFACGSSSEGSSNPPASNPQDGGGGASSGGCSGDVTACALGTLSDSQRADVCNLILTAIDAPSGAKYECTSGPNQGTFLTVSKKDDCIAQKFPPACAVKVRELVECYKAAKADACTALGDDGSCSPVLTQASSCVGN
jgi:hypothetical protein